MMYPDLGLPTHPERPYFYTNFVQTVDGKTHVSKDSAKYWPIGSRKDFEVFLELRAHADIVIHGTHTAQAFRALDTFGSAAFTNLRDGLTKTGGIVYAVMSTNPKTELAPFLNQAPQGLLCWLITTETATLPDNLDSNVKVVRLGTDKIDLPALANYLKEEGLNHVLIEGGPRLFTSFLNADLMDEIFLTIAPKLYGGSGGEAMTMIEGVLFPPDQVRHLKLVSVQPEEDEVYLRYKVLSLASEN